MPNQNRDKLLMRLIYILQKFNAGERYTKHELAEEFGVHTKTIERDLLQRLHSFFIDKDENGRFGFIEGFSLDRGHFTIEEMTTIVLSMGAVRNSGKLFRESAEKIIAKTVDPVFETPYYIQPALHEELDTDSIMVRELEDAILRQRVTLLLVNYNKKMVEPYKIIKLDDGLWYLLAYDKNAKEIKTFLISRIQLVDVVAKTFDLPDDLDEVLEDVVSAYFDDDSEFEVVIRVNGNISDYFRLRKQLPSQQLLEEYEDGSMVLSYTVTHIEDIDNIIKAWLPDIQVISPQEYRQKIREELLTYIVQEG